MAGVIVAVVVVALVVAAVVAASVKARRAAQEWRELAEELGLRWEAGEGSLFPSPGRVTGTYRGYEVELDYGEGLVAQRLRGQAMSRGQVRGSDGEQLKRACVTTWIEPELPAGLMLMRDMGDLPSMMLGLGSQDIQMGDKAFDDLFRVRGHDEDEVRRLLSPAAREALLRLATGWPGFWITTRSVLVLSERVPGREVIKELLDAQHEAVDALCKRHAEMLLEDSRERTPG